MWSLIDVTQEKKNFHTSSRNLADPPRPDSNVEASRQPKEKDLHGQQNEHLKHKPAEEADKGKGNASPDPHLPSKSASTGTGSGTRAFSTSTWVGATKPPGGYAKAFSPEATRAGYVSGRTSSRSKHRQPSPAFGTFHPLSAPLSVLISSQGGNSIVCTPPHFVLSIGAGLRSDCCTETNQPPRPPRTHPLKPYPIPSHPPTPNKTLRPSNRLLQGPPPKAR